MHKHAMISHDTSVAATVGRSDWSHATYTRARRSRLLAVVGQFLFLVVVVVVLIVVVTLLRKFVMVHRYPIVTVALLHRQTRFSTSMATLMIRHPQELVPIQHSLLLKSQQLLVQFRVVHQLVLAESLVHVRVVIMRGYQFFARQPILPGAAIRICI